MMTCAGIFLTDVHMLWDAVQRLQKRCQIATSSGPGGSLWVGVFSENTGEEKHDAF